MVFSDWSDNVCEVFPEALDSSDGKWEVLKHSLKEEKGERLAKWAAARSTFSRRQVEERVQQGLVTVNGITVRNKATFVGPKDRVEVDGVWIGHRAPKPQIWCFHKTAGTLVTRRDPQKRRTVFHDLPPNLQESCIPVGRLDYNTEGLLLLTNSGDLAQRLAHPKNRFPRQYLVRAFAPFVHALGELKYPLTFSLDAHLGKESGDVRSKPQTLRKGESAFIPHCHGWKQLLGRLSDGIVIDGVWCRPLGIKIMPRRKVNNTVWLQLTLQEGKNREIHRLLEKNGLKVCRLTRLSFGPFSLGTLRPRDVQDAPKELVSACLEGIENL